MKALLLTTIAALTSTLLVGTAVPAPAMAADAETQTSGVSCPVKYGAFSSIVKTVTPTVRVGGDFGLPMWAVVVNRDGVVCAVAFSGGNRNAQWLLSRQIAAAKAFTTNGLSTSPSQTLTTAAIYGLVQPGAPLFGVADGNPVDATAAYKGPVSKWGTANDPMVGHIIGGTISFGGGSPLVKGGHVVGGIGVSGDTADRDQAVSDALKAALGL